MQKIMMITQLIENISNKLGTIPRVKILLHLLRSEEGCDLPNSKCTEWLEANHPKALAKKFSANGESNFSASLSEVFANNYGCCTCLKQPTIHRKFHLTEEDDTTNKSVLLKVIQRTKGA